MQGLECTIVRGGTSKGVYRSGDGGKTWQATGPKSLNATSLVQAGDSIFVGGVHLAREPAADAVHRLLGALRRFVGPRPQHDLAMARGARRQSACDRAGPRDAQPLRHARVQYVTPPSRTPLRGTE